MKYAKLVDFLREQIKANKEAKERAFLCQEYTLLSCQDARINELSKALSFIVQHWLDDE